MARIGEGGYKGVASPATHPFNASWQAGCNTSLPSGAGVAGHSALPLCPLSNPRDPFKGIWSVRKQALQKNRRHIRK